MKSPVDTVYEKNGGSTPERPAYLATNERANLFIPRLLWKGGSRLLVISAFVGGRPSFQIEQLQNAYPLLSYLITSPHESHVTGPAFRTPSSDPANCG